MTKAGWIFMVASWAVILLFFVFSLIRTLRRKDEKKE
jgi:hypothetical protein